MQVRSLTPLNEELRKIAVSQPLILRAPFDGQHIPTNATELLLSPYPARLRLLRLCGATVTQTTSDYEIFVALCERMPSLFGTSAYAEILREVELVTGTPITLNRENCDLVWKSFADALMDAPALLKHLNVKKFVASPRYDAPYAPSDMLYVPDLSDLLAPSARKLRKSIIALSSCTGVSITSLASFEQAISRLVSTARSSGAAAVTLELGMSSFVTPNPYSAEQTLKSVLSGREKDAGIEDLRLLHCQTVRLICKALRNEKMSLGLSITLPENTRDSSLVAHLLNYLADADLLPDTDLEAPCDTLISLALTDSILLPRLLTVKMPVAPSYAKTVEALTALAAAVPVIRLSAPRLTSTAQTLMLRKALCQALSDIAEQGNVGVDITSLSDTVKSFCYRNAADFYLG